MASKITGMNTAVTNQKKEYQEYRSTLSDKVQQILGSEESISVDKLKSMSLFSEAYNKLNAEGKEKFDSIFKLDGDARNVSEKELQTLLILMDASLKGKKFELDGDFALEKRNGIVEATEDEINDVFKNTLTRIQLKLIEEASKSFTVKPGDTPETHLLGKNAYFLCSIEDIETRLTDDGIEYTKNSDGSLDYKVGGKTYHVYIASEDSYSPPITYTDILDENGTKRQTIFNSTLRSSYGKHSIAYDEAGNKLNEISYSKDPKNPEKDVIYVANEYKYDENGNKIMSKKTVATGMSIISLTNNGKTVKYKVKDDTLTYMGK